MAEDKRDDDDLLNAGFIDDEDAPTEPPSHPPQPAFDPFADAGSLQSDLSEPVRPQPTDGQPAADGIDPAEAFTPGLGADAPDEGDDPELKPGSRKDLWKCPHCNAGNKPGRDTCRACGKSPDEQVAHPLKKHVPWLVGVVVVAVVLLLIIAGSGADLSLKPAGPDTLDDDLRTGGEARSTEVGDLTFRGEKDVALSARVYSMSPVSSDPHAYRGILVWGDGVADEAVFDALDVRPSDFTVKLQNDPGGIGHGMFHLVDPTGHLAADLERGDYLSFVGQLGVFPGATWVADPEQLRDFEYMVLIEQAATRE